MPRPLSGTAGGGLTQSGAWGEPSHWFNASARSALMKRRQGAALRIQYDTALDDNVLESGVAVEGPDASTDRSLTRVF